MRIKPLPAPPGDLDTVYRARRAVPLVPAGEEDCCVRLRDRLDIAGDDEARRWLTFLRGLGLVIEGERGFRRARGDSPDLADAFREGVFGAREVLSTLGDRPRSAEEVFEAFEPHVPPWERAKAPGAWRAHWHDRTADLLDWLVLLDLADRPADGYVKTR